MTGMMEWFGAGTLVFLPIIWLILIIYPLVALGRIWLYSKRQVELLEQIRAALAKGESSLG